MYILSAKYGLESISLFFVSKVGINDVSFPNEVFDGGGRMKALLSQQITDFLTFFKGLLIAKNIYYAC